MTLTSNPLASRTLAVGLLILLILIMWRVVLAPGGAWLMSHRATMAIEEARFAQFAEVAVHRASLEDQLNTLRAVEGGAQYSLEAISIEQGQIELQSRLRELVVQSGAAVVSIRGLPSSAAETVTLAAVSSSLQIDCNTNQLSNFLMELERSLPVLEIDQMGIHKRGAAGANGGLRVDLQISAFVESGVSP